jgi:hypothetical protein
VRGLTMRKSCSSIKPAGDDGWLRILWCCAGRHHLGTRRTGRAGLDFRRNPAFCATTEIQN